MPLETVYQTLKKALKDNTHQNKHITDIYHAAWADWNRRIIQQVDVMSNTTNEDKFLAMRNLTALLVEEEALYLPQCKKEEEASF